MVSDYYLNNRQRYLNKKNCACFFSRFKRKAECSVFINLKYTGATMDVVYAEPSHQALDLQTAPSMNKNLKNVFG